MTLRAVILALLAQATPDVAIFRERAAPILERACLRCHDQAKRKGGLSLATRPDALAAGKRGAAVVPGRPEESLLVRMVSGEKPKMPKQAEPLPPADVAALRDWIAAGAPWPDGVELSPRAAAEDVWWSLRPVVKPPVPAAGGVWARTPVDCFILTKLGEQGLAPSAEADRHTLVRRLAFNLHGLPPAPGDLDSFEKDSSPDAYERLLDRLLASPRHGERWGRHWLDVVHYGDSHGYDKDKRRPNAWPYRDYVIQALNSDKPYARFVEEQLAGDILHDDDPGAIAALGFLAAGPWDFVGHVELREGTVDKAITRSLDRDDMLATTLSTFSSVTAHCARCHDHKFDPIPQEDYYRLQAVFAGVDRADRFYDADRESTLTRRSLSAEKDSIAARLKALRDAAARVTSPEVEALGGRIDELGRELATLPPGAKGSKKSETLGFHSSIRPSPDEPRWVQVDLGEPHAIDQVILFAAHVAYGGHKGPGFGFPPRFRVDVACDPAFEAFEAIADHTAAEFPNPGDAPIILATAGKRARFVRVTATRLWERTNDWVLALAEMAVLAGGRNVAAGAAVSALDSIEAPPGWAMKNLTDGFTSLVALAPPEVSPTNGYHSEIMPSSDATKWVEVDLGQSAPIDRVVLVAARPTDFPDTPGFGFPRRFRVEAAEEPLPASSSPERILVDQTSSDFPGPGDEPVVIEAHGMRARYVRVTATKLWERTADHVFAIAELEVHSGGRNVALGARVNALDSIEAGRWARSNLTDGYSSRRRLGRAGEWLSSLARRLSLEAAAARASAERDELRSRLVDPVTRSSLAEAEARLAGVERRLAALPAQRVVYAGTSDFAPNGSFTPARSPRPIHLLHRGDVKSPGPLIPPGSLSCTGLTEPFAGIEASNEGARRAALAKWITDPRNPFSWRSIVNRAWHYHFGRGLVETPNDFGRMGSKPTHLELLDWLAAWFRDDGRSLKRLHRLLLTSAVYRQRSEHNEAFARVDGENQCLWRMNRSRLEAEAVRDAILAASGRLDLAMGGPAVDQFFYKDDHSPTYDYARFDADDPRACRRSVYRFIVRSVPDPFMESLDCADPSILTPRRNNTLTALQALAMLNAPLMVRQAEHFAARVRALGGTPRDQIDAACRLALGRPATAIEAGALAEHAARHGLENVCRLFLNSNEFLFID